MTTHAEELTNCGVCSETFVDPQLLPCRHTFCRDCVKQMTNDGEINCHKCNAVCPESDTMPDFRLLMFLDVLAKQAEDLKRPAVADSEGKDVDTADDSKCELCEKHSVEYWCQDCELWICDVCKFIHSKQRLLRNHQITSALVKYAANRRILETCSQHLTNAMFEMSWTIRGYTSQLQREQTKHQSNVAKCNATRHQCHQQIDQHFDRILREFDEVASPYFKAMSTELQDVSAKYAEMARHKQSLEQQAASGRCDASTVKRIISDVRALSQCAKSADLVTQTLPSLTVRLNPVWRWEDAVELSIRERTDQVHAVNQKEY